MPQRFPSITGFVLAGGASRRMGRDKTRLQLGGQTLAGRQVRLLERVCRSVAVIGPAETLVGLDVPVIPDDLPGHGPLGAIYTALRHTRTELNLILGCDMPFMEVRFLRYLCARALAARPEVAVPETPHQGLQPLSAVYARGALAAIRSSLAAGENKVSGFFPKVRFLILPWREIARGGFAPRLFANLNTPQDFEDAERRMEAVAPLDVVA